MRVNPMMRTRMPALAIIVALLGFCVQANAQALCPQLTRLRNEAQETLKQSRTVPASERCYMYNRLSRAWDAVVQYANDNRESCHISISSLNEFERYHSEAVRGATMSAQAAPFAHIHQTSFNVEAIDRRPMAMSRPLTRPRSASPRNLGRTT